MPTTLVLGASPNPERYSYKAVQRLLHYGHRVIPVGTKKGQISGIPINNGWPEREEIDTVTLYLNSRLQTLYYTKIFELKPRRVIFNPGTENDTFASMLSNADIEPIEACTLVLLASGQY